MTAISSSLAERYPTLKLRLMVLRRRLLLIGLGVGMGWAVAAALAVLIVGAWLDLALDFPGMIRALLDVAALATAFFVAVRLQRLACRSASVTEMAKTLDGAAGARGQIVAGLDLATAPANAEAPPVTRGLGQIATRTAVTLIGMVHPETLKSAKALRRPLVVAGSIAAFILLAGLIVPRLVGVQWLRFADPFGDHPPYSSVLFQVVPGDAKAVYGSALDIQATTTGAIRDQVDLVYVPAGQPQQVVPMFPDGDGKWQATLVNVVTPGQYFLRSGRARTQRFDLAIITVPQIQKVSFRVTLPAYTNRPPYDGPLPQSGLAGLPGTSVIVNAQSNRPLSGGTLTLTTAGGAQTIHMGTAGDAEATGEFEIRSPGKFELKVIDRDGQLSTDSFTGAITLLTDQKPIVRIIEPYATSFATPDAMVKVLALAEDDYGISKLEIYRGLNDSRFRASQIAVPTPAPTQFPGTMVLRLADYDLSPGDVIKVFARTQDNDPAGPKGSESTVVQIHVVSQQQMDRMALTRDAMELFQSKYAVASRTLERASAAADKLRKEISQLDPSKPLSDAQRKELDQLSKDLAQAANDVDQLAARDLPIDLDRALKDQLAQLSAELKGASQLANDAGKPGIGAAGALDKLDQIRKKLGDRKQQFRDNATAPLQYLAKIFPLMQDQVRFIDIYKHQNDLAERLTSLEGKSGRDDPQLRSRMRDLGDEQNQTRNDLQQLLVDIDAHVAALPPDARLDDLRNTARDFAQAVRNSPADGQMQDAQTALDNFAGTRASATAHAAAETLDKFISRCNGMGDQAGVCLRFQPELSAGLGNSIDEMLSMSSGMGMGGSGGYFARRNSLMNVGLYGSIPLLSSESRGGGGHADHGIASRDEGAPNGHENPDSTGGQSRLRATGAGAESVPPQYKKQVGEYFQRVDDELAE
jgi:hypothetical protein